MSAISAITFEGKKFDLAEKAIDDFQGNFRGTIINANDSRYHESRAIWNGMIDRKPCLIAQCRDADDVAASVKFARQHNLKFSVRSGGHHVGGKSVCDDGLVIDLSQMKKVTVNVDKSTATVQGGAKLIDIDTETAKYGLTTPLGVVSDTGVAGLALHGGYGWQSRKNGLSLDNILGVDIVTADGRLLKANEKENSDLFWAIRGGGGNFGIVTSFEFKLHPIEKEVWLQLTFYPVETARKGLKIFREYVPKTPDELSAIALFWNAPPEELIPEEYRGKPVFITAGCYTGSLKDGEKIIAPLRQIDNPVADLTAPMPFDQIQQFLDPNYPNGRHYYWKSAYLNELGDDMIELLIEEAATRPSPMTTLNVWGLGGKTSRIDPQSTAFYHRQSPFMISMESSWDNPADSERNINWARNLYGRVVEKADLGQYLNFPGFGEEGDDLLKKAYGPNYQRLKEIKAKYDPGNFFQGVINF